MITNPLGPINFGKEKFFFQKLVVSALDFGTNADIAVTLTSKNSLLFINQGPGVVEVSFNGLSVHAELNTSTGTSNLIINDPSIVKVWFRLKSGAPSIVSVQNDAIANSNTVNLSVGTIGGTSSNFNDFFPAVGTAVGFNDGTNMQGARVFDADTNGGAQYVLGSVLRASAPGGSVETGTAANPLRINPTGTTAQPVTDNGGSLTVDGTVTANIGTTNGLALDATLTNGTQKAIVRGGSKGTTTAADVTSTSINADHQALDVTLYNADGSTPLSLDGFAALDAFGRFRVSTPFTVFENKQIHNSQTYIWTEALTGGGSTTYSQNRASTTLNVFNNGDKVIRQTKERFNYQSGLSFLILVTFVMGPGTSGISKKIGYFDQNNGIYFENNGATNSITIRSNVTGTPVPNTVLQTNWNIDPLNGAGPSGLTLDVTKSQIFVIDIEWLGVGSVRCGFVINGKTYYVHKFDHSNIINSVYMSTPNLPVRSEIENVSAGVVVVGNTLEQICCSVMSEGGYNNPGLSYSVDRGISPLTNADNAHVYPLVSIRLEVNSGGVIVVPQAIDILCTSSNANFKWVLAVNPVINGVDAASWVPVAGSVVEYDVSRTLTNYMTNGYIIASGYGTQKAAPVSSAIQGAYRLGSTVAGVRDELVLGVQKIAAGGGDNFIASISWKEYG